MATRYKITERKLKRHRNIGQIYFEERLIEIDSRLPPKEWQSTLIHEAIHAAFHDMPEKEVLRGEKAIASILWDAGLRRIHLKKD